MREPCYDVFEFDEPAFELFSDAEMQSGCAGPTVDLSGGVEIAHAVTLTTAIELVGLPSGWADHLEREVAEHSVGNLLEQF